MKDIKLEQKFYSHLAFDSFHLLKHEYTIILKGNLINGRKFYGETKTNKSKKTGRFGKASTFYYFSDTKKGDEFKSIKELLESIGLSINE